MVDKSYKDEANEALAPARATLAQHKRAAAEIFTLGEPSHEIAAAANDGFHMSVMGTQGRSGLGNLFMGSAAARALVESNIPVRLVK